MSDNLLHILLACVEGGALIYAFYVIHKVSKKTRSGSSVPNEEDNEKSLEARKEMVHLLATFTVLIGTTLLGQFESAKREMESRSTLDDIRRAIYSPKQALLSFEAELIDSADLKWITQLGTKNKKPSRDPIKALQSLSLSEQKNQGFSIIESIPNLILSIQLSPKLSRELWLHKDSLPARTEDLEPFKLSLRREWHDHLMDASLVCSLEGGTTTIRIEKLPRGGSRCTATWQAKMGILPDQWSEWWSLEDIRAAGQSQLTNSSTTLFVPFHGINLNNVEMDFLDRNTAISYSIKSKTQVVAGTTLTLICNNIGPQEN